MVLAVGFILGLIVFISNNSSNQLALGDTSNNTNKLLNPASINNIKPVTQEDHIRGNPQAPVKIVEFSDLECPYCKRFHTTMKQILTTYKDKVAWVYRHFPLDSLHPKARKEAEATECAAELGGNEKFWEYVDRIFEITPSNNGLDLDKLPQIAEEIGLDRVKFESCLNSGKYASKIAQHLADAVNSGAKGTPFNIVIALNGKKFKIQGAQSYNVVKSIIDLALQEK